MLGIRKGYWITAATFFILGLFFYFLVYAYQFTGMCFWGLAVLTIVAGVVSKAKKILFPILFIGVLVIGLILTVTTGEDFLKSSKGSADPRADYAIVLGAGVNGTEPSASLRERISAAKAYAEAYPEAILILSGSQGPNEDISEAQCMYNKLTEAGISPSRLVMEEKADDTEQNLLFSLELIEKDIGYTPETVCIISSEYHLLRAGMHGEDMGFTPLLYPARTENRLYFCNMFLREIVAVWECMIS